MTREEFKNMIGFTVTEDNFYIKVSGGVTFKSDVTISKSMIRMDAIELAKDQIQEAILKNVYDDKRKAFIEKIIELSRYDPFNFSEQRGIYNDMMEMARAL